MTDQPKTIQLSSPAKINWLLSVGPLRSDNYHELTTVFHALEIADPMSFTRRTDELCMLHGYPADIAPESNLVTRAWNALRRQYPGKVSGVDVSITKTLPAGGGLGGGSANAAITLRALKQMYSLQLTSVQLQQIGAEIGSDVPFFINGGCAIGRGRGELLEPVTGVPPYHLVLLFPGEPMSTGEAYRQLDSTPRVPISTHTLSHFSTVLKQGDPHQLAGLLQNDFELVAQNRDWYKDATRRLTEAGALVTLLCGSGSTVAGLAADKNHALLIAEKTGGYATSTCVT